MFFRAPILALLGPLLAALATRAGAAHIRGGVGASTAGTLCCCRMAGMPCEGVPPTGFASQGEPAHVGHRCCAPLLSETCDSGNMPYDFATPVADTGSDEASETDLATCKQTAPGMDEEDVNGNTRRDPVIANPVADGSAIDNLGNDKPIGDNDLPIVDNPVIDNAGNDMPVVDKPVANIVPRENLPVVQPVVPSSEDVGRPTKPMGDIVDNPVEHYPVVGDLWAAAAESLQAVKIALASQQGCLNKMGGADGYVPLRVAIHAHQPDVAKYLIEQGARTDIADIKGTTILMAGAQEATDMDMVALVREYLLAGDRVGDINAVDNEGRTAVHYSCMKRRDGEADSIGLVQILAVAGALPNVVDMEGQSVFHYCAKSNRWEELRRIQWTQGIEKKLFNTQDKKGRTPLHTASVAGSFHVMRALAGPLAHGSLGADINIVDNDGLTPVMLCATLKLGSTANTLIRLGARVTDVDHRGFTTLQLLIENKVPASDAYAQELRATVGIPDNAGIIAPMAAMINGEMAWAKELTELSAVGWGKLTDAAMGRTTLMYGVISGMHHLVPRLEATSASVDIVDHSGWSYLHYIITSNSFGVHPKAEWTRLAMAVGAARAMATTEHPDNVLGRTELLFAAEYDKPRIVQLLASPNGPKRLRSNVDFQDKQGDTALHIAAGKGYIKCVGRLLAWGANADLKNKEGQTAADAAIAAQFNTLAAMISGGVDDKGQPLVAPPTKRLYAMIQGNKATAEDAMPDVFDDKEQGVRLRW